MIRRSRTDVIRILAAISLFCCHKASEAKAQAIIPNEFRIVIDFRKDFKIEKNSKIYFRASDEADPHAKDGVIQNAIIRPTVALKLNLVEKKNNAEYLLQIRLEKANNFAIKNKNGKASDSYAMFSICTVEIVNIKTDCQNTTYYSFSYSNSEDLLRRAFALWLGHILHQ